MNKLISCFLFFISVNVAAQQEQSFSVVVEKGEQLGTIAQRYLVEPANKHWAEIVKLNGLKAGNKIYPGMTLQLPLRLVASQAAPAKWLSVTGSVQVNQKSGTTSTAVVGAGLLEGERVVVGANSSALLALPDGSQIKMLDGSEFVMDESRYYVGRARPNQPDNLSGTKSFSGLMRLIQGSVETRAVPATDRAKPLRVQTPTAVVGVRGTEFRVSYADVTRSEVIQGLVAAQLDDVRRVEVAGGFGVKLDPAEKQIPAVVALLNAPDLTAWPLQQEKSVVEFPALPSSQGARAVRAYRVQLASDAAITQVTYNKLFPSGSQVRIPQLPEGEWHLLVRGVDEQGLEGKNASSKFTLKVKPQPPLIQTPKSSARTLLGQDVLFSWLKVASASGYVIELQDGNKTAVRHTATIPSLNLKNLSAGDYQWRIATQITRAQGAPEIGFWSDWQNFTIVAKPDALAGDLDKSGKNLSVRWSDLRAKEYEVQIAREPNFESPQLPLVIKRTTRPELSITNIESGTHFLRYRAIEADGFVGHWSSTMETTVPKSWSSWLHMLGWTILAL